MCVAASLSVFADGCVAGRVAECVAVCVAECMAVCAAVCVIAASLRMLRRQLLFVDRSAAVCVAVCIAVSVAACVAVCVAASVRWLRHQPLSAARTLSFFAAFKVTRFLC